MTSSPRSLAAATIRSPRLSPREAALHLLARRRARGNLLDFTRLTKRGYRVNWHHRLLAEYLDRLVAGDVTRLVVSMPPRHGKTELCSRRLPAYLLGRDPDTQIIACSHTAELAIANNRDVQRILTSDVYRALFPATRLSDRFVRSSSRHHYRRTSDLFEVIDHAGYYRSAGVGGAITGHGFDVGIIDDPVKSREEADSPAVRERVWQWFTNDFYSRRSSDARILLVMTRWHRDDLAGRLLRQQANREADRWEVLALPAVRTGGTGHPADPRAEGEALWPEFLPADELEKTRKQDPRAFAALYQQDPTTAGGSEWPIDYFGEWIWCPPQMWPRTFDLRIIAVDPSKGGKDRSHDYSAIVFMGVHNGLVYVDADLDRRPPHRIVEDTLRMCDRYKPDMLGFESNQFQELLVHEFERICQQRMTLRWPVYKLVNKVNKEVRIRRLGPYLVNRELRFKQDSPGCHLLVDQLIDFPHADHDDGPDALEMAVRLPMELSGGN